MEGAQRKAGCAKTGYANPDPDNKQDNVAQTANRGADALIDKRISSLLTAASCAPRPRPLMHAARHPQPLASLISQRRSGGCSASLHGAGIHDLALDPDAVGTTINAERTDPHALVSIRSGYDQLADLSLQMQQTQALLGRGMRAARSSLANRYYLGASKILGLVGVRYEVPDLRHTMALQLRHVQEYGSCIHTIIDQTQRELKSTHMYVTALGVDLSRLYSKKDILAAQMTHEHPSQSLDELSQAVEDPKQLQHFLDGHHKRIESLLAQGDDKVTDRAINRKKEYIRHAYAVQLLLTGSLTAAKKIAVDAGCYASMLQRLSSAYFALGCNSQQLDSILGGLETMQHFTDSMQESVASALQRLEGAMTNRRTYVGNTLESAVHKLH